VIAAGTGSAAYARTPDGALHRAGGYGWQLGDGGGGYWLGRRALALAAREHDNPGEITALGSRVMRALGLGSFDDLVRWATTATPAQVAALAPEVLRAASAGDAEPGRRAEAALSCLPRRRPRAAFGAARRRWRRRAACRSGLRADGPRRSPRGHGAGVTAAERSSIPPWRRRGSRSRHATVTSARCGGGRPGGADALFGPSRPPCVRARRGEIAGDVEHRARHVEDPVTRG
jgi:hypothetical protein